MPRVATGQASFRNGKWFARVTLGDARPSYELPTCKTEEAATARARVLAELASKLTKAGQLDIAPKLLERAASRDGKALAEVLRVAEQLCSGELAVAAQVAAGSTVKDLGDAWISGKLATRFPDHVKRLKESTTETNELRFRAHVVPVVGDIAVAAFTLDDAERVMASLDRELSPASRRHVAQILIRLMNLAVYPLKLRTATPIPKNWRPQLGPPKAKPFLLPEEEFKLASSPAVPTCYRILYGVLHREGMRAGEALALRWRDVDLERGLVHLDENKTDDPRTWALDPGVSAVLCAWRALRPDESDEAHVFVDEHGRAIVDDHLADRFRTHLRAAGVDRPQLFEQSNSRRRIVLHTTRATFVTVKLAVGKTEAWIADRTGHRSSGQINAYRRPARSLAEAEVGDLRSLPAAFPKLLEAAAATGSDDGDEKAPEKAPDRARRWRNWQTRWIQVSVSASEGARGPRQERETIRTDERADDGSRRQVPFQPASVPFRAVDRAEQSSASADSSASTDALENALAVALERASAAGRWDVVAQLARELEARRLAGSPSVVVLEGARAKRGAEGITSRMR